MSFFESQAFAALIGGVVLITVSGGQAWLSYKNSKLLVEQTAAARRDETAHAETQWRRQNTASQVTAIEQLVSSTVRLITACAFLAPSTGTTWPAAWTREEVVEGVMNNLRAFSAARDLDPSGELAEAVEALYQLEGQTQAAYLAKDEKEVVRIYSKLVFPQARAVTASLAAAKAR